MTEELEGVDKAMTAEEKDIDCLFELCKEDFPFLSSEEQTINIGKFLHVSQIKRIPDGKNVKYLARTWRRLGSGGQTRDWAGSWLLYSK